MTKISVVIRWDEKKGGYEVGCWAEAGGKDGPREEMVVKMIMETVYEVLDVGMMKTEGAFHESARAEVIEKIRKKFTTGDL